MRSPSLLLCLLLALGLLGPAAANAAEPTAAARAVMDETVDGVLAILGDDALDTPGKRQAIEAIARERFDFETMAKLVLKRDWKKFSDEQRVAFVDAFRSYLAASYGNRITRYDQEAVDMVGERLEKRGDVTVLTRIAGGEADGVALDYRLRRGEEEWRVIDVVIEGISLVSNFRSQFADVLNEGGPTLLLEKLQEKNAESAARAEDGAEGEAGDAADADPADDAEGSDG